MDAVMESSDPDLSPSDICDLLEENAYLHGECARLKDRLHKAGPLVTQA
jgi:hypothetical protein